MRRAACICVTTRSYPRTSSARCAIRPETTHRSLVRKLATFCLPLLLIYPVSLSSRIQASTNGTPVLPSHHLLARSSGSSQLGVRQSPLGRSLAGYVEIWSENPRGSKREENAEREYLNVVYWKKSRQRSSKRIPKPNGCQLGTDH